jgi:putative SOS response-associated peptidase YedK
MRWGFDAQAGTEKVRFLVRDDSADIDTYARCLIPATALPLRDREGGRWTASLEEGTGFFCFAGVWRPASESSGPSYAAVTVPAYPDLRLIKRRHIAILPQHSWTDWLAGAPAASVLRPLPRRSLHVVPT